MSSTITPITMTLTGQYASDYQGILNKAVQTAQVPLTALQTADTTALSQKAALGQMQSSVSALTASLTSLGALASAGALSATSSNTGAVTASNTGATAAATYTINSITSTASAASETSLSSYADATSTAVSSTGQMQLVVGSKSYDLPLANNNLNDLVSQINGLNAGVTASVLTTSGGSYLSLQATATGATTLQLNDDPTGANKNVLTATNQGTDAVFELNGIPVKQSSNVVNGVIPGLTFDIVAPTNAPVTLTLASDASQISSALQSFVTNYNAVASALGAQGGFSGGALAGDSIISQLQQKMQQVTSFFANGSGSVQSLAELGITFDGTDGQLSFDSSVVDGMGATQIADALKYIGASSTGLGQFAGIFDQYSNSVDGLIQTEIDTDTSTDTRLHNQIDTMTDSINAMQQGLARQLEASDTLESNFESQQTELTATLQGLSLVLYGKNTTNS